MTTETIAAAGYHRPDVAVKLEVLRSRFGYAEAPAASLYGKSMTLAVVRGGELQILEGRLDARFGGRAVFVPKGHRTSDDTLDTRDIIGHVAGYGYTPEITRNALAELDRITADDVRIYLAAREQAAWEDAARQAAAAIARIGRDLVAAQEDRRAADAKILDLLDTPEVTRTLAA